MRTLFYSSIVTCLLIFMSGQAHAERKPLPGAFQPDGSYKPTPGIENAFKLKLDTFATYFPDDDDLTVGAALAFKPQSAPNLRPSIQVANQKLGLGLAYRIFPVVDGSVGVSVMRDFDALKWRVGAFVSIASW